jgi:uncharacterized membrane protein
LIAANIALQTKHIRHHCHFLLHCNPRGNIYELPGALMHDYYGLVLKTTVLMVLTVFLIVMITMVVALAVAAAMVVVMSQKSCSGDGTFTARNAVYDTSRNSLAL